jgi:hypothetical protein
MVKAPVNTLGDFYCANRSQVKNGSACKRGGLVFFERASFRTVREAIAAAGAFMLDDLVPMVNVLQLRMDGALRADFAAEAAGDAERFDNTNFHEN